MKRIKYIIFILAFCSLNFNVSFSQTAEEYFYRAIDNAGWSNYVGALRDFNRAIDLDSTFADAFYLRGDVKGKMGDFNGAVRDFIRAATLKPFDAEIHYDMALVNINLRNHTLSFENFNKSIELNPASERTYLSRGVLKQYILEDFAGAIEDYDQVLRLSEKDPTALYNRAVAKIRIGKYSEALADYKLAFQYNIYNDEYYYAARSLQIFIDSITTLDAAINTNARNADAYVSRGKQKIKVELFDAAIEDFTKAIEINPNDAQAFLLRANVKTMKGAFAEAVDDYNMAISKSPSNPELFFRRAALKHHFPKDYAGAITDYNKAIELDATNLFYLWSRGDAKVASSKFKEAVDDYSLAIQIDTLNITSYIKRGDAKTLMYDFEGAINDYSKVIEINPKEAEAFYKRGLARHRIDQIAEACLDLSLAGEYGYIDVFKVINNYCNR